MLDIVTKKWPLAAAIAVAFFATLGWKGRALVPTSRWAPVVSIPREEDDPIASPVPAHKAPLSPEGAETRASGILTFERADARVHLTIRAARAAWLPNEHLLRIVLLETLPPKTAHTYIDTAVRTGGAPVQSAPYAILEMRFAQDALTPTRDSLETATLMALNAQGLGSSVDIRDSLAWNGALPLPDGRLHIELKAQGIVRHTEDSPWDQQWQIAVELVVEVLIP